MLKYILANLDGLSEELKKLYTEKDGQFYLTVDGIPKGDDNIDGLKKKSSELLDELKAEREKRRILEAKTSEDEIDRLKKQGDFESLQKITEEKHTNEIKTLQEQLNAMKESTRKSLINTAVAQLSGDIAGTRSSLIAPHIQKRISVIEKDGEMITQILDANGNPSSTMTLEQLGDEFKNNELFAPIVLGRDSNGGGGQGGGGQGGESEWDKYFDPSSKDFSMDKCVELETSNPVLYKQMIEKYS